MMALGKYEAPQVITPAFQIAIAGLSALAVAIGVGRFAFTPLFPMMQEDFGLTVAAGGWLAFANYAGYLLGAVTVMLFPARPPLAIRCGLVVTGLVTVAMGLTHRLGDWIALRALAGVASAWVLVHVSAWALERLEALQKPVLSGVVFAGVGAGTAVVGLICLVLMQGAAGASGAWIVLGIASLLPVLVLWRAFSSGRGVRAESGTPPSRRPQGWHSAAARLVFSYAGLGYGYIIPATFLPAMAREAIRDPAVFGWSWPVFGAAAALSTLAASWLSAFMGNRALLLASLLVMALGVALPLVLPGMTGILLSALCVGGTFMVATMTGLKEAREHGGSSPTRLMAAMTAAFALGQMIGPITVSYAGGGYSAPLLSACVFLTAGACALIRRPARPK